MEEEYYTILLEIFMIAFGLMIVRMVSVLSSSLLEISSKENLEKINVTVLAHSS